MTGRRKCNEKAIRILFDDDEVETTLSIEEEELTPPGTGEAASAVLWILMLFSAAGLVGLSASGKHRNTAKH